MKPPSLISPSALAIYSLRDLTNLSFAILQLCVSAVPVAFPLQATMRDSPSRTLGGIVKLVAPSSSGSEKPCHACPAALRLWEHVPLRVQSRRFQPTERWEAAAKSYYNVLLSRNAKVFVLGAPGWLSVLSV